MRFLLIKALADGHLYSHFVASLQRAFAELGHEAVVAELSEPDADGPLRLAQQLQASDHDAVVSFSSFYGGAALDDGRSLFDACGVPFVGWQVDHPIYSPQSLARAVKGRRAVYAHPAHLRFAETVRLPGRGLAMLPGGAPPPGEVKAFGAREWPILIAATWNGEPQPLWEDLEDGPARRLLFGVRDQLLSAREPSVLEAFEATSSKLKLGMRLGQDESFDEVMRKFLCEALTYVRHLDRIAVVRGLVDSGLPVVICGDGWRDYLGPRNNVTYLGTAGFDALLGMYGEARVVLNFNGANGGCERAVNAALAGAAVVSDYGAPLDELFGAGDGIAFFNRTKPETAAHVVRRLLHRDAGEAMAARGRAKVLRSGLWRHRAQQLADFVAAP